MKFLENTKLIINLAIIFTTLSVVYFLVVFTSIQKKKPTLKMKIELNLMNAYQMQ